MTRVNIGLFTLQIKNEFFIRYEKFSKMAEQKEATLVFINRKLPGQYQAMNTIREYEVTPFTFFESIRLTLLEVCAQIFVRGKNFSMVKGGDPFRCVFSHVYWIPSDDTNLPKDSFAVKVFRTASVIACASPYFRFSYKANLGFFDDNWSFYSLSMFKGKHIFDVKTKRDFFEEFPEDDSKGELDFDRIIFEKQGFNLSAKTSTKFRLNLSDGDIDSDSYQIFPKEPHYMKYSLVSDAAFSFDEERKSEKMTHKKMVIETKYIFSELGITTDFLNPKYIENFIECQLADINSKVENLVQVGQQTLEKWRFFV